MYLSPYPAKNKYFVMPFIQKNVLNRQIHNLFPMTFWRWEGREKALTSAREVHVFILHFEFIAKSFPSYLQWKSPGDKVGKCIFCTLVYCFFYRSFLFAIVLWSPYKLIQGNEGNTKTRFFALYFLPMNIYCLRQVNQYIKYQYLFNEIIENANKLHGCF